jgi:hypothetical protein
MRWEEALIVRDDKAWISEHALDEERAKADAARQEYLNKIEAHTACGKAGS